MAGRSLIQQGFQKLIIQALRVLPGAAEAVHQKNNLRLLREALCDNQSRLAEYCFFASQLHKKIRVELDKYDSEPNSLDKDELTNLLENLSEYLDDGFRNAASKNFKHIHNYFESKIITTKMPRICIKAVSGSEIITLVRDRYTEEDSRAFPVDENTAFTRISQTGEYYICNNIPLQVSSYSDPYCNARINPREIRQYKKPWLFKDITIKYTNREDDSWIRCWKSFTGDNGNPIHPLAECCYKSTLVIPMTLRKDDPLSQDFRKHFKLDTQTHKSSFGFLCFDHQNTNFFSKDEDVDMGYIYADLMSLYLIIRLNYTTYSDTYDRAQSLSS